MGRRPGPKKGAATAAAAGAAAAAAGAAAPPPAAPATAQHLVAAPVAVPPQHHFGAVPHAPAPAPVGEATLSALQTLEEKKKRLSNQLKDVERQIYDLETKYLEAANPHANALKGYDGLRSQLGSSKPANPQPVAPGDRLFSSSSTSACPPQGA